MAQNLFAREETPSSVFFCPFYIVPPPHPVKKLFVDLRSEVLSDTIAWLIAVRNLALLICYTTISTVSNEVA